MQSDTQIAPVSKKLVWAGRIISALPILMMLGFGIATLINPAPGLEGFKKNGYPESSFRPILITQIVCVILYAIPQTSVLGAILLTGYLGGAVATHVRLSEPFYIAVLVGVFVWLGILLRDRRLQELLPFRKL
jgi:hypothetical protein